MQFGFLQTVRDGGAARGHIVYSGKQPETPYGTWLKMKNTDLFYHHLQISAT